MSFLSKLFNGKDIKELEEVNLSLSETINNLKEELNAKSTIINAHTSDKKSEVNNYRKQWELMEKNLRNLQQENLLLKNTLTHINSIIPKDEWSFIYLVDLHIFYSTNKFINIREKLLENNIIYLQDISSDLFTTLLINEKHCAEAAKKYQDYKKGIIEWEVKTLLLKGDRVTKIYQKSRKLLNILSDHNIEFMRDLDTFNFQSLQSYEFSQNEIELFKEKYNTYNSERKIK